ncbi:MAG: molybdopterin molybdotransferase MoeA [Pirellulales bacterium]|nr:molybdopterin molybdotransferase MoeA [Pirellulales bacterium]
MPDLLSVAAARETVLSVVKPLTATTLPLDKSIHLVLAEEIHSTGDSPPFSKAMVDGYAVGDANLGEGEILQVTQEIFAGAVSHTPLLAGQCARIMTGAPIPTGTAAVVMHERTRPVDLTANAEKLANASFSGDQPHTIQLLESTKAGQNILKKGAAISAGQSLLQPGQPLSPACIGLLADQGITTVAVHPRPTVAILSTGDELVPIGQEPVGAQIRNSNSHLLQAAIHIAGGEPRVIGIARDNLPELRQKITLGLNADILLLSGGVSAGLLDLVPQVLQELGVRKVFHKIRLKPGKPLWFGVYEPENQIAPEITRTRTLVFGLPGNPVSSGVCCELFVKLAIAALRGLYVEKAISTQPALLANDFIHRGDRPTYFPARLEKRGAHIWAMPLKSAGSADLLAYALAEGLIAFPAGDKEYFPGDNVEVLPLF